MTGNKSSRWQYVQKTSHTPLARRHLNSSQCAFVALEVERVLAEEAKERQVEAGKQRADSERNEVGAFVQLVEFFPQAGVAEPESKSREKAASIIGHRVRQYCQTRSVAYTHAMANNRSHKSDLLKLPITTHAMANQRFRQYCRNLFPITTHAMANLSATLALPSKLAH